MLLDITIQNFRSFKERNTLSFEPLANSDSPALPLVAVYGPNASGKSNVVKAMLYIREAMLNESAIDKMTVTNPVLQPFMLNRVDATKPILFEFTTYLKPKRATYRYGFEIFEEKVKSEWLIESALRNKRTTERELFVRNGDDYEFDPSVRKYGKLMTSTIPDTVLAIQRFANNNMPQALDLVEFVRDKVILFDCTKTEAVFSHAAQRLSDDESLRNRVIEAVKNMDIGIKEFNIAPQTLTFNTIHNVYSETGEVVGTTNLDYHNNESLGSQNLILFMTMVIDSMDHGFVMIADEFGNGLHPFITAAMLRLFKKNPHAAQLIVFTHETYLLGQEDLLEREMIWFVDKNSREESSLVSLAEYKLRPDARVEKQYLEGRFGAVPVVLQRELEV